MESLQRSYSEIAETSKISIRFSRVLRAHLQQEYRYPQRGR